MFTYIPLTPPPPELHVLVPPKLMAVVPNMLLLLLVEWPSTVMDQAFALSKNWYVREK